MRILNRVWLATALALVVASASIPVVSATPEWPLREMVLRFDDGTVPAGSADRVEALGGSIIAYAPAQGLVVRAPATLAPEFEALPGVLAVEVASVEEVRRRPDVAPVDGIFTVKFDPDSDVGILAEAPGLDVVESTEDVALVSADPRRAEELATIPGVAAVEPFVIRSARNEAGGGTIIGSATAEVAGFDGAGQIVAIADSGLGGGTASTAHRDIPASRIQAIRDWPTADLPTCWDATPDGSVDVDTGHGTHVTGSAVSEGGPGGEGRGTAPGASVVFQSVEDFLEILPGCGGPFSGYFFAGIPSDVGMLLDQAYDDGARVHSDSWGVDDAGAYSIDSAGIDDFVWEHQDMTVVVAGGNAGEDANADGVVDLGSIGSPGTAKNVIAVGASENVRPGGYQCDATFSGAYPFSDCSAAGALNDTGIYSYLGFGTAPLAADDMAGNAEQMAAFSSRGPTDDGRIKPDVVAPGTWILSTYSDLYQEGYDAGPNPQNGLYQALGWGFPYDAFYKYNSGTSMAAPLVAGSAAIVRQYVADVTGDEASAALVKALLINSAVDLADENNDGTDDNDIPIPNMHEGWGRVDVAEAVDGGRVWFDAREAVTDLDATFAVESAGTAPLKITLVWSDHPSSVSATTNLVNDLDLVVTAPNGTTYRGNRFSGGWSTTGGTADRLNNVENVYLLAPATGTWSMQVRGHNVPFGPQPYALVIDGATATVDTSPAVVIVDPAAGSTVQGETDIEASASDDGSVASVRFSIGSTVLGTDTDGTDGWTMQWDTRTTGEGSTVVTVTATDDTGRTASDAVTVTVDNPDPSGSISSPSDGAFVSGLVPIEVLATNADRVVFAVDGVAIGVDGDGDDGWGITWDTIGVTETDHRIMVTIEGSSGPDVTLSRSVVVDNLGAGGTFVDDDGNVHEPSIEALVAAGITRGCSLAGASESRFCPSDPLTRGQMAAFLVRGFGYPSSHGDRFGDDDASVFEGDIEALASARVTLGCNPPVNDRFCPDDPVTRGQMAAFLVRALDLQSVAGDRFIDDDGSVFEAEIQALAGAGVTFGCNPPANDMFCPEDPVLRDQMASFLTRALGLTPLTP